MVLIDTCVWIDFLRGLSNPKVDLLTALLEEGEAFLCEITFSEICFGAKDRRQYKKYSEYFSSLPFLSLPQNWHQRMAEMGFSLKTKGFRPYVADLMIGLAALEHAVPLLTFDKDFEPYRDLFGLALL